MHRWVSVIAMLLTFSMLSAAPGWAFYDPDRIEEPQRGEWGFKLHNIPLVWAPTKSVAALDPIDTTVFRKIKINILPFSDSRSNSTEIGRNTENKDPRLVTTKDNVPAWLTDQFIKTLAEFNIKSSPSDSGVVLEASILKFYAAETSVYKADVALDIKLVAKNGTVLWEGMVFGSAKNFGGSYKENNYHEALSNATIDLVYNFLKFEPIRQALKEYH